MGGRASSKLDGHAVLDCSIARRIAFVASAASAATRPRAALNSGEPGSGEAGVEEFVRRLQQRKLMQWALAYVAAAFALLQIADIVGQRFGWPEQAIRLLIVALTIGFVVTLVLAWYHGERGMQRVTG